MSNLKLKIGLILTIIALGYLFPLLTLPVYSQSSPLTFSDSKFNLAVEFNGWDPTVGPSPRLVNMVNSHMLNAFETTHVPVSNDIQQYLSSSGLSFIDQMAASTKVYGESESYIADEWSKLKNLTSIFGKEKIYWNLMPEFDQSGGWWIPEGRPRYSGLAKDQAYNRWKNYYLNSCPPLGNYLAKDSIQRGVTYFAVTDYAPNVHYAHEMGVDMTVLERHIDGLGDLLTGIAFNRGAGRQYDKPWGIDLSGWRSASGTPTQYNDSFQLTGGWSPSYTKRHLYTSYMSGVNIILMEAIDWFNSQEKMNPTGQTLSQFGDFALNRHKDRGKTVVNTALMLDFYHGFDPKHGKWNQENAVWYQDIPYSDGDYMLHNLFNLIFPDYWKSGTLPSDAPQTPEAYRSALTSGSDPRPWEPMGPSRYGDQFDVILNNAPQSLFSAYKTIILSGDIRLTSELKTKLQPWINSGGTLIVNANQISSVDEDFLGIQLSSTYKGATNSRWIANETSYTEPEYQYLLVTPTTATVIANNSAGDPLVTKKPVGLGAIILTTPKYLQNNNKNQILNIGQKLIEEQVRRDYPAQISGPFLVDYIVNTDTNKTIVTVVNNSGTPWSGSIAMDKPSGAYTTTEWLSDTVVGHTEPSNNVVISAQVPEYDVRIYALEYSGTLPTPTPTPSISGDLDKDGDVDKDDVLTVLRNYGKNPSQVANYRDPVGDEKINGMDFGYVTRDWGL